jgi:hypothetical protein
MRCGLALLCVGGLLLVEMADGQAQAPRTGGPALDKATLAKVRELQKKRRDALRDAQAMVQALYVNARIELSEVVETSRQLLTAELELAATGAERIAAYERLLETAQMLVGITKARLENARGTMICVRAAQALSLEAQIGLLKAGGKLKEGKRRVEPIKDVVPPPKKEE